MTRVLINAVSAKHGGARTIIESLVFAAGEAPEYDFIVLAGFEPAEWLPPNVIWYYAPKTGVAAMAFSLVGVVLPFLRHRANVLISFNNINCILVPNRRRITYFHQLKALDRAFSEPKVWVIRTYLCHSSEPVVVQSGATRKAFEGMFGRIRHDIIVAWPGVLVPSAGSGTAREPRTVLVPVASPQSPHKNFTFIQAVADGLGPEWRVVMTAPDDAIDLGQEAGNVEFIGALPRNELFNWYRRATVVLMASTHETIGLPIFEALAVGTPVVTYEAAYICALRDRFMISDGLSVVKTCQEAVAEITAAARSESRQIKFKRDFRRAEWIKIFNRFKELT